MIKFFSKNSVIFLSFLILALPAALKLILPGFYEPHDLHHFADIYEMYRAFTSGQFPPRLGPDFLYNFGYPLFNFYYVLPFYLGALFLKLFGSIQLAYKLVFLSCIVTGIYGMYLLLREFTGKLAAFVGTVVFLYTPYRAVQIYVRGAMGEALSLALTPLIAYALIKVVKNPGRLKQIAVAGLTGAIFILAHNFMWALTLPWIIILALIFAEKKTFWKSLWSLVGSGVLMLGISAYWWVPAIIEQKLVAAVTPFPLIDHFPFIKQLIIPSWGYGPSITGPYDGLSFQIGIVNLIGVGIAFVAILFLKKIFKEKKLYWIGIWGLTTFFVMFFMMNIRSYPIWKILPFHDFIQFPWRLLSLTTFLTAILIATVVELFRNKLKFIIAFSLMFGAIILTFNYFQPSHTTYKTDNEYLSRFFANRAMLGVKDSISIDYLNYSEDYLLLPKTDDKKPDFLPTEKIISDKGKVQEIKEISPIKWTSKVISEKANKITFYGLNFPGWYASVDGLEVDIHPAKPYGQIEIDVPSGSHEVAFNWKETPLRRGADLASILFLIASLAFVFKAKRVTI